MNFAEPKIYYDPMAECRHRGQLHLDLCERRDQGFKNTAKMLLRSRKAVILNRPPQVCDALDNGFKEFVETEAGLQVCAHLSKHC
jgi:hypothetical protein